MSALEQVQHRSLESALPVVAPVSFFKLVPPINRRVAFLAYECDETVMTFQTNTFPMLGPISVTRDYCLRVSTAYSGDLEQARSAAGELQKGG